MDIEPQEATTSERFLKKVEAVRLSLAGENRREISARLNITLRSLQNWIKTADENSFDALRTKVRAGIKPKLSTEQCEELRDMVLNSFPFEHGDYGSTIWKARILVEVIKARYSICLSERTCRTLLTQFEYRQHMSPYCVLNWRFEELYHEMGADKAWIIYKAFIDRRNSHQHS